MASDGDNLNASLAHIVLACVAGRGVSRMSGVSYTHPGMHANFFIHSIVGFLHYQSGLMGNDFKPLYVISLKAARYLALPCLNADLRRNDQTICLLHVLSGVIPFAISLAGEDNVPLGNLAIALNIISLCHYSHTPPTPTNQRSNVPVVNNREFGWYTAGAACLAYFVTPQANQKFLFPLALALMEYCAYRIWHVHYDPPLTPGRR